MTYEDVHDSLGRMLPVLSKIADAADKKPLQYSFGLVRTAADRQRLMFQYKNTIDSALQIIAANWAAAIAAPYQAAVVKRKFEEGLTGLMKQTLTDIMRLMMRDVQELTPLWSDSASDKELKQAVMDDMTKKLRAIQTEFAARVDSDKAFHVPPSSTHIVFKPGPAMIQLAETATNGIWEESFCKEDTHRWGWCETWLK